MVAMPSIMDSTVRLLLLLVSLSVFVAQGSANPAHQASVVNLVPTKPEPAAPFHKSQFQPAYQRVEQTPLFFPQYHSQRTEMKYGPFEVEPMSDANGMVDYLQIGAEMPCSNCTITFMQASLEYLNGSTANANTSLWLHHIVLINLAEPDTVCGWNFYAQGQRWFASGNERTPANLCLNGTIPTGYYLSNDSVTILLLELMNQGMESQTALVTITYEYIEGLPSEFFPLTPIWLDIGGCQGNSDQVPKTDTTFQYSMPAPWKSNFTAPIIGMGAHVHDGGTHLEIFKNNQEICNCIPEYGGTPGYWDAPGTSMTMPMDPNFARMDHISSISSCYAPTAIINAGDELDITAYYNFTEYMPMLNTDGTYADIMGITILYVAKGMSQSKMESYVGSKVAPLAITPEPTTVAIMDMSMDSMPSGTNMHGMQMAMYCVPARDSPGTISTAGLNMADPAIAMDYLMALLNDTCLQVWSNKFAEYFWYGIVTVIGLFTLSRLLHFASLQNRKRKATAGSSISNGPLSPLNKVMRAVTYPQVTPTNIASIFKLPNIGTQVMIASYFGFLLALEFINVSTGDDQTYQSMGVRGAWLSVAQIPLIVLLASKRNFVGYLTAVTYERLNVLHRWTARGLLLTATMHFGFQSTGWARAGVMQLEWNSDTCPPTGIAAYAILLWINLSNLAPFRHLCYEFFVVQHIVSFMGLIIAIMIHIPTTALHARVYIYIAVALYLSSRLIQTLFYVYRNIRPRRATLSQTSENVTKITIKNSNVKSWTPGSFVLLSIPRYGIFQSHPATIASTPTSHNGDLIFFLRNQKGFTKKISRDSAHGSDHMALIDGPYGGQQSDFAAFQSIVLVAGSTGVSFTLPILLDIASRLAKGRLPLQEVTFVWAMKDQPFIQSLKADILSAIGAIRAAGINVTVQIHVTGAYEPTSPMSVPAPGQTHGHVSEKSETSSNSSSDNVAQSAEKSEPRANPQRTASSVSSDSDDAAKAVTIASGRPDLKAILLAAKAQATSEMAVAACGPLNLSADVRNIVARMQGGHGTYLHVEGYGW